MDASEIREWRIKHGYSQSELAKVIGQKPIAVSKIECGNRLISPAEQKLLENFIRSIDAKDQDKDPIELCFTKEEWSKLSSISFSEGFTDAKQWIVSKIKNYIAMHG